MKKSDEIIHNISRKGNFAWICIPKVASVSIRQAIVKYDQKVETVDIPGLLEERTGNPGLFIFAFVRDPVERAVSCWRNIVKEAKNSPRMAAVGLNHESSWEDYLDMLQDQDLDTCDMHWRRQARFLVAADGSLIPDFLGSLSSVGLTWSEMVQPRTGLESLVVVHRSAFPRPDVTPTQDALLRVLYAEDQTLLEKLF